ncbi:MAG: DHHA1 domain-containing protein [Anaeromicrobium sp.]|uniref:alanyl-tRNA editing protein n=1 Tax=Anaeromicrobium sp. TaxID=1929132 RepID=UPI0025F9476E|nr:DHHA1 domain-containing protein [Anaeromicrobium sp.]MCT4593357.1 DHHA1 domain-containing protein [Anaeromicrobium sp.]
MCKKLYYENTYLKNFTANIVEIKEEKDSFHLVLDKTAFYPEGGGQPSDMGFIEGVSVNYVYTQKDKVYHVVDSLPSKKDELNCSIDWSRRFDFMQQHTGQHILSACVDKLYGGKTVGFHLSKDYTTIDVTTQNLKDKHIQRIEQLANEIVFANLTINQFYPDSDTLKELPLRKTPSVDEDIRVVSIDSFDHSPCGGTHVDRTGEVGLIKIKTYEKTRGKTRLEFVCGNRAYNDYLIKNNQINSLSTLLSIKDSQVYEAVERIYNVNNSNKKEINKLQSELIFYEGEKLYNECISKGNYKILKKTFEDRDFQNLRTLALNLCSKADVIALLGTKKDKAQFILAASKNISNINMKDIVNNLRSKMTINGGGNNHICQGGVNSTDDLELLLSLSYDEIIS